jgi:hypothetical protein
MIGRLAGVLAHLLRASWMVDAGWSPALIAAHYQADRGCGRRSGDCAGRAPFQPSRPSANISEERFAVVAMNHGGSQHRPFDAPDLPIWRVSSTVPATSAVGERGWDAWSDERTGA